MAGLSAWTITYTNPDRALVTDLDDPGLGLHLLSPMLGVGMPPVLLASEPTFDFHGEIWEHTRYGVREITIPVGIIAKNEGIVMERLRALSGRLRPANTADVGYLTFKHPDYDGRRIWAHYAGGMETSMSPYAEPHETWITHGLVFRCFDPLFEDENPEVVDFQTAGSVARPFFPLFADADDVGPHFGASTLFEQKVVNNVGDDLAYPLWEISGPASSLVLGNLTSNETIDLSRNGGLSVATGDTLVIDTRPTTRSIVRSGTVNGFPYLTDISSLWALQPGSNLLSVQAIDATAATRARLTYRQRRLTI